jgi:alpha-D-ribose 1-methylphosphonate 5-triphosphate synthase subunit PhnI
MRRRTNSPVMELATQVAATLRELRSSIFEDSVVISSQTSTAVFLSADVVEESEIVKIYSDLPGTQKCLMTVMYKYIHKPEILLDELFIIIGNRYAPDLIPSVSELHYRILDLVHKQLLSVKAIGHRTTSVLCREEVAIALTRRNKMNT